MSHFNLSRVTQPLLAALLILILPLSASATHIVGGQMRMNYLSPGRYNLGLTLYFDAVNGSIGARDPSVTVYIFEKRTNVLKDVFTLPFIEANPVEYTNSDCQINTLATDELNYQLTVTLNPARYASIHGYYIAWERCCRNRIISNIQNPSAAAQTFYLEFPALLRDGQPFINSSPHNFLPIGDYACAGTPFLAPFGGTDLDGDSLVYDLITPLNGHADSNDPIPPSQPAPYDRVLWLPGFDSTNQITGPQPLRVDRQTGQISFTAGQPGLYVFGVRCSEYRNGIKIGEVRREFQQLVVGACDVQPAHINLTQPGAPHHAPVYVPGTILTLPPPPAPRCLNVYATDGDPNSWLYISLRQVSAQPPAPLPTLSINHGVVNALAPVDTLIAQLCFSECFGRDGGQMELYLIVEDGACPIPHRDSVLLQVEAQPAPNVVPTLVLDQGKTVYEVKPGESVAFDFTGHDPDPDTRVTVQGANLTSAKLRDLLITCPTHTALNQASTRLTWPVDCSTPPGDYDLRIRTTSETCGRLQSRDTTVLVRVLPPDTTFLIPPNIFTPNGDGVNDTFQPAAGIPTPCGQEFRQVRIFNRWGRELFVSRSREATWTGQGAGEGMYFYFLEYSDRSYKGWVELVR